jgi:hypothetical protein
VAAVLERLSRPLCRGTNPRPGRDLDALEQCNRPLDTLDGVTGTASDVRARGLVLASDGVRLLAVGSVVVGLVSYGAVAGALFFLVLGGTIVPRVVAAPAVLDLAYSITILVAAWAAVLDWYVAVGWLDVVVHAAATGLVAAVVHVALVQWGALPEVGRRQVAHPRVGIVVVTAAVGVALATLWEFGEWFGHTHLDSRIQVGYTDTIGDLAAGSFGALVAAILLAHGELTTGGRR